jgi:hypothetical protein
MNQKKSVRQKELERQWEYTKAASNLLRLAGAQLTRVDGLEKEKRAIEVIHNRLEVWANGLRAENGI